MKLSRDSKENLMYCIDKNIKEKVWVVLLLFGIIKELVK